MFRCTAITFFFIGCALFSSAQATDSVSTSINKSRYQPPSVILFMLHLSTNKIEGLRRRGMEHDIPMVMAADKETNESIMKDFAAHFTYCPVYFFYDDNYDKATTKQFAAIQFYTSQSMPQPLDPTQLQSIYFAEVSYAAPSAQLPIDSNAASRKIDHFQGDEDDAASRNYGINMYDADFKPLRGKLCFTDIALRRRGALFGEKKFVFEGALRYERKLRALYSNPVNE